MGVEILPPGGHLCVEFGDAVQDRHGGGPDGREFLPIPGAWAASTLNECRRKCGGNAGATAESAASTPRSWRRNATSAMVMDPVPHGFVPGKDRACCHTAPAAARNPTEDSAAAGPAP